MKIRKRVGLRVRTREVENVSPMESVANLVDVMLVFACGLIIALIAAWNVDVSETPYTVDSISDSNTKTEVNRDSLTEKGTLYQDPATGKYYIIEDE